MLEMKCLGTVRSIVCITATFTQQIVGQIVLGRVVFRTSLACYLHSYHAENILDWLTVPFFSKGFRCALIYLSYHIEINPKRPTTETSGSVHHRNLSRPKSPDGNDPNSVICTATMLKLYELVYCPILRLKKMFFGANLRNIGSSPHSIKNVNKADTLRNRTQLGIRKMLCVHDTHIPKNNWVYHI